MVLLKGNMEIHESEYIKKKSLPNDYIKRLERSGSERYCVLIFKTFQVDLYIDGDRCTSVIE